MIGNFIVGVSIILEQDGKFLLGRRSLNNFAGGLWEFPSGRLEVGENPYEAAIREGKEELNLRIKPVQIIDAYTFRRDKDHLILINTYCTYEGIISKSAEHEELRWIETNEVADYFSFESQKITAERTMKYLDLLRK